jgi:hypothetical protein
MLSRSVPRSAELGERVGQAEAIRVDADPMAARLQQSHDRHDVLVQKGLAAGKHHVQTTAPGPW